jgi:hypothetical protein
VCAFAVHGFEVALNMQATNSMRFMTTDSTIAVYDVRQQIEKTKQELLRGK